MSYSLEYQLPLVGFEPPPLENVLDKGFSDPRKLGALLAETTLDKFNLFFPINLVDLANCVDIVKIKSRRLGHEAGSLYEIPPRTGSYIAYISADQTVQEQELTLAHEVGHRVIKISQINLGDDENENFCESFASHIVLPDFYLDEALEHLGTQDVLELLSGLWEDGYIREFVPPQTLAERLIDRGLIANPLALVPVGENPEKFTTFWLHEPTNPKGPNRHKSYKELARAHKGTVLQVDSGYKKDFEITDGGEVYAIVDVVDSNWTTVYKSGSRLQILYGHNNTPAFVAISYDDREEVAKFPSTDEELGLLSDEVNYYLQT